MLSAHHWINEEVQIYSAENKKLYFFFSFLTHCISFQNVSVLHS